jgi:hypothetical protein
MSRKCTVCAHKDKAEIDRKITANEGSALTISRLFNLSKDSILRHRRHISIAIRSAQSIKAQGFSELLKGVERLIRRMEKRLSDSQRAEGWFKESAELRQWIALRAKLAGKLVKDEAGGAQKREGDRYSVVFIAPDGKPAEIPLSVYRALPKSVFDKATDSVSVDSEKKSEAM